MPLNNGTNGTNGTTESPDPETDQLIEDVLADDDLFEAVYGAQAVQERLEPEPPPVEPPAQKDVLRALSGVVAVPRGRPAGRKDSQPRVRRTKAQIEADKAKVEGRTPDKAPQPRVVPAGTPLPTFDESAAPLVLADASAPAADLGHPATWPVQWPPIREVDDLYTLTLRKDFYPQSGLIPYYMKWAGAATDISPAAHWAGICAAVAAQLGRGQRIAQGAKGVVPSFFALVLAESGGRKSYALKLLRSCLPPDSHDSMMPRSDTSLLKILVEHPWRFWCIDEASALFKLFGNEWSSSLAEFLCKIYDGDEVRTTTITRGELSVPPMHLSLLAMTTFATLLRGGIKSNAVEELIGGGLFGRFFVIPLAKPENPRFEAGVPSEQARQFIQNYLINLRRACPWSAGDVDGSWNSYDLTPEANLELMRWQSATGAGGMGNPPYDGIASMWTRLHVQVKRLALIYHLASGKAQPGDLIDVESLWPALKAMHYFLVPAMLWFARKARYGALMIKVDRVRDELQAARYGLRYSDLCKTCGLTVQERTDVLAILHGEIAYEWWLPQSSARRANRQGHPHTIVVARDRVVENYAEDTPLRPGERRTRKYAPPPPAVLRHAREMSDKDYDAPHPIEQPIATQAEIDAIEGVN